MKFHHTEHKKHFDKLIKEIETNGIVFPYYSQLKRHCNFVDFACAYADMQWANSGFNSYRCSFCPLEFKNNKCPNVAIPYEKGDRESCIKALKLNRDAPIKEGVEFE